MLKIVNFYFCWFSVLTVGNRFHKVATVREKIPNHLKAQSHPVSLYQPHLQFANRRADKFGSISAYIQALIELDRKQDLFSSEIEKQLEEKRTTTPATASRLSTPVSATSRITFAQ